MPIKENTVKKFSYLSLSNKTLGALVRNFSEKRHRIQFRAKGDSMFPFIRNGDRIIVSPYTNSLAPELGDIVVFIDSKTEHLIVHRLIRIFHDKFETKGDNCFNKDEPQPIGNILGYISEISNEKQFLGIDPIKAKKQLVFFSRFGLTAILGGTLKKLSYLSC